VSAAEPSGRAAFILMPFEEPFNAIYTALVTPALSDVGYEVRRADSVLDQQNVLRDIVTGIDAADLLVADLTDLNPNVFYELGIAHGLGIPTVLLTQSIDDVPFDLRGYRVKEYSSRFDKAPELKDFLTKVATEHATGKVSFGSPVSDFLPNSNAALRLQRRETSPASSEAGQSDAGVENNADTVSDADIDTDEKGVLDLLGDMQSAGEAIGEIGEKISGDTAVINEKIELHTKNIEKAVAAGSGGISAAQVIARAVASDMESYAQALKPSIKEMSEVAQTFSDSSLVWLSRLEPTEPNLEEIRAYAADLSGLKATLTKTRGSMAGFRDAIAALEGWSVRVDRANRKVISEIDALLTTLDYLLAFTSRGGEIADEKLQEGERLDEASEAGS
jgi:hypothetical protein